jgi:3'-5' exoribonuclease
MYIEKIRNLAKEEVSTLLLPLVERVLCNPKFAYWSGSSKPEQHHFGTGGLAKHTWEVIDLCFSTKRTLKLYYMSSDELFLAALYHDVGKIKDYRFDGLAECPVNWRPAEHKRLIHHISASAIEWSKAIDTVPLLRDDYHDNVLHAILSHHGQREWGSPVAPKTQVAWLLHLCDGISARMDDWNKADVINKNK